MRHCLIALLLALALAAPVGAQVLLTTGTLAQVNDVVAAAPGQAPAVTISISGTFTGLLTFSCADASLVYSPTLATRISDGATGSTTISGGIFFVPNVGCNQIKVAMTTYVSGTATVVITQGFAGVVNTPTAPAVTSITVQPVSALPLPPCNPVRNYNCQPKGF